jgi:hypothetical protein
MTRGWEAVSGINAIVFILLLQCLYLADNQPSTD